MSVKKIVTSEQEGSTTGTNGVSDPNSFIYDTNGLIYYKKDHGTPAQMFMEPGVVYGSGYEGGENGGRPVIKLRPDDYANADQQVVIDATAPNHIHIRAGGTIDNSNAELHLGGEQAHVRVVDSNHQVHVKAYNSGTDVTHHWTFGNDGILYGPAEGTVQLYGLYSPDTLNVVSEGNMRIESVGGDMNFYMDGAAYIGDSQTPNRIVRLQDLEDRISPQPVRYQPTFAATGLTFTGTGATYPTYNSFYVKSGSMVTFNIAVDMATVTNFGTGQFTLELPFAPIASAANHFSAWAWVDPSQPADELNGHVQLVADHLPGSTTLDLHWLKETTATPKPVIESLLVQGTPITFTTASKLYVNGTYISA